MIIHYDITLINVDINGDIININQRPFQALIYWRCLPNFQAYIRPMYGNIPTKYVLKHGTVPPFWDPEIPIDTMDM